ncbi:serine/threonine-protein kinase 4 isoform X2 [Mus pahari]|uniref:serine/threonine-protein kinase 4 isoform X2 n=1 Tax=Mus pahari TaxID=10093 RepID=UPI000A313DC4|nr:serine/threonine-protein kinase 4 isoform X2 [Mus pahari]
METVQLRNPPRRQLKKLDEDSLTKQPEEVFDVLEKLGEGSYGSVYKAIHKETGQIVAIKQVPVESDLQEIIKEISIMQQCDSPHVVKYYGSYFKNTDLWIVMEYCGAGSVSDIIRLRNKTAIFMIPTNPPPTFRKPELWSDNFMDFVKQCLVKSPEQRATATQLLQHPFVKSAKGVSILRDLINEAMDVKLKRQEAQQREVDQDDEENSEEDEMDSGTMVRAAGDEMGTVRVASTMSGGANTMIEHGDTLPSQLGTMVINTEDEEEEGTMKRRDETMQPAKPSFLEYFEQKEKENQINSFGKNVSGSLKNSSDWKIPQDGDYEFLKSWTVEDLQKRLLALDPMMEQEMEEIRQKYRSKRQPILDAIEAKKRRQQNF